MGTARHRSQVHAVPQTERVLRCVCLQVTQLPRLSRLQLRFFDFYPDSMAALAHLSSSLTHLRMEQCSLPTTLSALTRLQHLQLTDNEPASQPNTIGSALRQLQQLTCLVRPKQLPRVMRGAPPAARHALAPKLSGCCPPAIVRIAAAPPVCWSMSSMGCVHPLRYPSCMPAAGAGRG